VIEFEENYEKEYEGFDINSPEGSILFSLYQSAYMSQSISFASMIQEEVVSHAGRSDRGVRQAGFLVLVYTAMPAVLIETGFATNPKEEKFLASDEGQVKMAESIFQAFIRYKKEVEGTKYLGLSKEYKPRDGSTFNEPVNNVNNYHPTIEPVDSTSTMSSNQVVYKVQFMSSKTKLDTHDNKFKSIESISYIYENGWYKYMSGAATDLSSAKTVRSHLVGLGYTDAFIVSFKGNEKIKTH